MLIPIENVKVQKRIREDMGDIEALAESLKRLGQISPIVITKNYELVAGGRRLEAARYLGWSTIDAVMADIPDELTKLEYEIEENLQRRDFLFFLLENAAQKKHYLQNPPWYRRVIAAIVRFFKRLFRIK
jgi:ParB family chromosome partitioning protein